MQTVTEFPHEIIEEENVFIPVTDGLHLAARIWRPKGSDAAPVPAILEYIPYRKRFGTRVRDEHTHPYLAGHGYACIRLDILDAVGRKQPVRGFVVQIAFPECDQRLAFRTLGLFVSLGRNKDLLERLMHVLARALHRLSEGVPVRKVHRARQRRAGALVFRQIVRLAIVGHL